jgi:protein MpaA
VLLRFLIAAVAFGSAPPPVTATWHLLGRSVDGRPIRALELRGSHATHRVVIIGCIHGNECAGLPAIRHLERARDSSLDLWLVPNLNPDGLARGTRQNAHGVDLNRNFPSEWRSGPRGLEYPGARPLSEPESRIATRLILRVRPQLTIWFHQPQAIVRAWGPSIPLGRIYARAARMPFRAIRWPHGTAPNWQNHRFAGCAAFVVELPPGPLSPHDAARQAQAVLVSSRAARC